MVHEQIQAEKELTQNNGRFTFLQIFKGSNRRRTIAAVTGVCSQPLAGAPLLFSYSTYYFSIVGLQDPFLVTVSQMCPIYEPVSLADILFSRL